MRDKSGLILLGLVIGFGQRPNCRSLVTRKPRFQRGRRNWGHRDGSNYRPVGRGRPAEPQCGCGGQEVCCHRVRIGDACQDPGRGEGTGQDGCREDHTCQDRARERHSGQDRPGQGRRGQARGHQDRPHKTAPAKTAPAKTAPAKAPAARKAAPARRGAAKGPFELPAVRDGEDPWTTEELAEIRTELEEQARELRGEIDDAEIAWHELQRDSGDGAGDDQADAGTKTFEREHELSLANNSRDLLAQVDRALSRLDNGTYGICENCGQPVGKARLQAFPRATLCVTCKQREERR